jgi:hypothetical protein
VLKAIMDEIWPVVANPVALATEGRLQQQQHLFGKGQELLEAEIPRVVEDHGGEGAEKRTLDPPVRF